MQRFTDFGELSTDFDWLNEDHGVIFFRFFQRFYGHRVGQLLPREMQLLNIGLRSLQHIIYDFNIETKKKLLHFIPTSIPHFSYGPNSKSRRCGTLFYKTGN